MHVFLMFKGPVYLIKQCFGSGFVPVTIQYCPEYIKFFDKEDSAESHSSQSTWKESNALFVEGN